MNCLSMWLSVDVNASGKCLSELLLKRAKRKKKWTVVHSICAKEMVEKQREYS